MTLHLPLLSPPIASTLPLLSPSIDLTLPVSPRPIVSTSHDLQLTVSPSYSLDLPLPPAATASFLLLPPPPITLTSLCLQPPITFTFHCLLPPIAFPSHYTASALHYFHFPSSPLLMLRPSTASASHRLSLQLSNPLPRLPSTTNFPSHYLHPSTDSMFYCLQISLFPHLHC